MKDQTENGLTVREWSRNRTPRSRAGQRSSLSIVEQKIQACTECRTLEPWRKFHPSVSGTHMTRYLLVGEAPGYRSWRNGRRFTGPAGVFLRRALSRLDHPRFRTLEDLFYLTDAVKCHPAAPDSLANRAPRAGELGACLSHLIAEVHAIRPPVIVTIGRLAGKQTAMATATLDGLAAPEVLAVPHPSPRNQRTIRRQYGSYPAFEDAVTELFRTLIVRWEASATHA